MPKRKVKALDPVTQIEVELALIEEQLETVNSIYDLALRTQDPRLERGAQRVALAAAERMRVLRNKLALVR